MSTSTTPTNPTAATAATLRNRYNYLRAQAWFCGALCLCLFLVLVITWMIMLAVLAVVLASFKAVFQINPSSSISPSNTSSDSPITMSNSDIVFSVQNPSKFVHVDYGPFRGATMSYLDMTFSATSLPPPFSQKPNSVTIVRVAFSATLPNPGGNRSSVDDLAVDVVLRTRTRFVAGGWWGKKYELEVICSGVRFVNLPGDRTWTVLGAPVKCKLEYCYK